MPIFIRTILLALAGLIFAIIAGLSSSAGRISVSAPHITQNSPQDVVATTSSNTTSIVETSPATSTTPETKKPPVIKPAPKVAPTMTSLKTPPQNGDVSNTNTSNTTNQTTVPPLQQSVLNTLVRGAIVNILCVNGGNSSLHSISASGVLIHPDGVIITNAHVGQYFLLKDYPDPDSVQCTIRTGSPAVDKYTAELLFLPPSWITANAQKITQTDPTGNGEHDYALLRITGAVNGAGPLPTTFPYLQMTADAPATGENMIIAGYPAGFLGGLTIQQGFYATSAFVQVGDLFTFVSDTIDLFSVGGSVVAQQGASGGATADENGTLTGLLVTTSDAANTSSRDLRAVSTAYIVRDFAKESGVSLQTYLNGDLGAEAQTFAANTAPTLTQELLNAIAGH